MLAEAIGVDPGTGLVSRWVSGERTPTLEMACRICEAIGLPVEAWRRRSHRSAA
jgi:transcriptional regulator with XRE-family HTH domain